MTELLVETALIPRPQSFRSGDQGPFRLSDETVISTASELVEVAEKLRSMLRPATGFKLPVVVETIPAANQHIGQTVHTQTIIVRFEAGLGPESFRLEVDAAKVTISASTESGAFYAAQALAQLLPPAIYRRAVVKGVDWEIPGVLIEDSPQFGWRGLMIDVARHFLPKAGLLRMIDLAAMHRLNTVQLHLTDDQGWRIEIKAYPRLVEIGSWRSESQLGAGPEAPGDGRPHGGFYTQDDLREIVAYAAERYITIIPEIEVPGHVQAVLAAYPEFGVTTEPLDVLTRWGISKNVLNFNDKTLQFVRDVFDEVMDIFPSRQIGIGGDECPKDQWRDDPQTQQQMATLGIRTEEELQFWFVRQLTEHLRSRGRVAFGWDEVLEGGLAENLVVASWRGLFGARQAARSGVDAVAMPCDELYLDYRQSEDPDDPCPIGQPNTAERIFTFSPVPSGLTETEAKHILGGAATIFTEHIYTGRELDFALFPRLAAFADAIWAGPDPLHTGMARLARHLARLDAIGVEYRPLTKAHPWQRKPGVAGLIWTRAEQEQELERLTANIISPAEEML